MAKRSTPSDKVIIDPVFTIPEGAEDQFSLSREDIEIDTGTEDTSSTDLFDVDYADEILFEYGEEQDYVEEELLDVPENFAVIAQTLRRAPGGQQVVDIIIETEDVDGAMEYEIQVTKI